MNEHHDRRAARRQDLALLFADAWAAGYRPLPPQALSEPACVPARAVPGPGSRVPARDFAAPPA